MESTDSARFAGTIGPANLLSLVRNTAPFLFEGAWLDLVHAPTPDVARSDSSRPPRLSDLATGPMGWLAILHHAETLVATATPSVEEREDYFALCLACHHATVATYIPTDVDSKIRGLAWQHDDADSLRRMFDLALHACQWDTSFITTRAVLVGELGSFSGHNGEWLSVLSGALGAFVRTGDQAGADAAANAIDTELRREVAAFRRVIREPGRELDVLRMAAILTHNVGDIDQGISFWRNQDRYQPYRARFGELAHDNAQPFDGVFQLAAHVYKHSLASEGHRHYPLREVRALRRSADYLLPISPFLDEWGERVGSHRGLNEEDRAAVLAALLLGCKKIHNQVGYYRAVAGMERALGGKLDVVARHMPAALRGQLKDAEVRRHFGIKQVSFESSLRKRATSLLTSPR